MDCRIVTTDEEFNALKPDWERIEEKAHNLTYFSTYQYAKSKWIVLKKCGKYKLWIVCVWHNGILVGLAPLMITRKKNRFFEWNSLQLLAVGDYGDFVIETDTDANIKTIYKSIFDFIDAKKDLWQELDLHHIHYKSPLSLFLLSSEYNKFYKYLIENPYIDLELLPRKQENSLHSFPRNINNYCNKLKKAAGYIYCVEAPSSLEEFSYIHRKEKEYYHSIGNFQRHSQFENKEWFDIVSVLCKEGKITAFCLRDKNNNIIIYKLAINYKNIYYDFNNGYNPVYAKYNLGKVLIYEMHKQLTADHNVYRYDFGSGRYHWKFEWATGFNLLYRLYLINPKNKKLTFWKRVQDIKRSING